METSAGHKTVEPIKIVIPHITPAAITDVRLTSPTLAQHANLSQQPTVAARISDKIVSVKLVTMDQLAKSPHVDDEPDSSTMSVDTPDNSSTAAESPKKMRRECKQLEESVNSSKVLTGYVQNDGRRSRGRRKSVKDVSMDEQRSRSGSEVSHDANETTLKPRRRKSNNSRGRRSASRGSEVSVSTEGRTPRRANMRSAKPEFIQKQQKFLQKVNAETNTDGSDAETQSIDDWDEGKIEQPPKPGSDYFCWRCTKHSRLVSCSKCIRSYHMKCLKQTRMPNGPVDPKWRCPECSEIEVAEKMNKGKPRFDKDFLSTLLSFVMKRMLAVNGADQLTAANDIIDTEAEKYIVNKMNLDVLQDNVEAKKYRCMEAFHADVKWLIHNSKVSSDNKVKLVQTAKNVLKTCKQELNEIDTCFECYYKANVDDNWFIDVCARPHIILWAKLKGFPFWPAKAMSVNATTGLVDVRFFGAHDRSWIPLKDCFLYSEEDPNVNLRVKRGDLNKCIREVDQHIEKLKEIYGEFKKAPVRTPFDPSQSPLMQMLPNFHKYQRSMDTSKLIEELVSGTKPKLTLKIIRTADNNLSTAPTESSTAKKDDEIGITKFKITTEGNNKSYQITPVPSTEEKLELTMKRSAEAWTIMEKNNKRQKSKSEFVEESDEKRKEEFVESLHLHPTGQQPAKPVQQPLPAPSLPPPANGKPRGRGRPPKSPTLNRTLPDIRLKALTEQRQKRRQTMSDEPSPVPEKRVLRNRNKSISVNTPEPKAAQTTSPPPLVPFETAIKIEPSSDDDSPTPAAVPQQSTTKRERINVRDINTLQRKSTAGDKQPINIESPPRPHTNGMISIPPHSALPNGPLNGPDSRRTSANSSDVLNLYTTISTEMATTISDILNQTPPLPPLTADRPTAPLRSNGTTVYASEAGPASRILIDNSHRMTDFFRSVIQDTLKDLSEENCLEAKLRQAQIENEQLKYKLKEIEQVKQNSDKLLNELRNSHKKREAQLVSEIRKQCDQERVRAIEDTKKKRWCVNCMNEARSYCCTFAWYCSTECQLKNWSQHMQSCDHPRSQIQQERQKMKQMKLVQHQQRQPQMHHQQVQQKMHLTQQQQQQQGYVQRSQTTATPIQQQQQRTATGPQITSVQRMVPMKHVMNAQKTPPPPQQQQQQSPGGHQLPATSWKVLVQSPDGSKSGPVSLTAIRKTPERSAVTILKVPKQLTPATKQSK